MPRFRWHHCKCGRLRIPGQPPRPDPRDPTRLLGGEPPKMLVFCPDGEDGVYDTEDPSEIAALRASLPARRGMLTMGGQRPPPRGPVAVVSRRTVQQVLSAPLPYFEEPEPFGDVLAVVGRG